MLHVAGPWLQAAPKDMSQPRSATTRGAMNVKRLRRKGRRNGAGPAQVQVEAQACAADICKNIDGAQWFRQLQPNPRRTLTSRAWYPFDCRRGLVRVHLRPKSFNPTPVSCLRRASMSSAKMRPAACSYPRPSGRRFRCNPAPHPSCRHVVPTSDMPQDCQGELRPRFPDQHEHYLRVQPGADLIADRNPPLLDSNQRRLTRPSALRRGVNRSNSGRACRCTASADNPSATTIARSTSPSDTNFDPLQTSSKIRTPQVREAVFGGTARHNQRPTPRLAFHSERRRIECIMNRIARRCVR